MHRNGSPDEAAATFSDNLLLKDKKVLLAVTGSIAAYKAVALLRLLKVAGAEVQVLMTQGACDFVRPLTFSALSGKPVLRHFHTPEDGKWHNHIDLATWADVLIFAPLSAHMLAKMAHGQCDNLLLATYLSARCPVVLAPAMDVEMYAHATTVRNLRALTSLGHQVLEAETGALASGLHGQGRMVEPGDIFAHITAILSTKTSFAGRRVLITSGATEEALDPVRFITNRSSGKMGSALARAFAHQGAEVDFVCGTTSTRPSHERIHLYSVRSAEEMCAAASKLHPNCHICIFAAAVADFRPKHFEAQKMKSRKDQELTLPLCKNPDIALKLGRRKKKNQFHVGFALETHNERQYAKEKLEAKNFDLLVLNSCRDKGSGFYHDTNKVAFFYKDGREKSFPLQTKVAVAQSILNVVCTHYNA